MKAPGLSADIAQPGAGEIHVLQGQPRANATKICMVSLFSLPNQEEDDMTNAEFPVPVDAVVQVGVFFIGGFDAPEMAYLRSVGAELYGEYNPALAVQLRGRDIPFHCSFAATFESYMAVAFSVDTPVGKAGELAVITQARGAVIRGPSGGPTKYQVLLVTYCRPEKRLPAQQTLIQDASRLVPAPAFVKKWWQFWM